MKHLKSIFLALLLIVMSSCNSLDNSLAVEVVETSAGGNQLATISPAEEGEVTDNIKLLPEEKFQTITGFEAPSQRPQLIC